jgi:hypothetical protein
MSYWKAWIIAVKQIWKSLCYTEELFLRLGCKYTLKSENIDIIYSLFYIFQAEQWSKYE